MAHDNDENRPPFSVKKHNLHVKRPHMSACSRLAISTTAANSSTCFGVLRPQELIDGHEVQLSVAQQQLEVEQCRSMHLQLELEQARCNLADLTAWQADLHEQLRAKDKQLQQMHSVVAAAEAARQKAAADCNKSAGIALKHVEHVQQLQHVVQQKEQQINAMHHQLQDYAVQLRFARKLHVHTAALLSVRELQLAEALQHQEQQGDQKHALDKACTAVTQSEQHEKGQQQGMVCSLEAAEEAPQVAPDVTAEASAAAVKHCVNCSVYDCGEGIRGSSAKHSLWPNNHEEAEEEGASTPLACHPARPTRPALANSKYRSRLSLAEQFDAAATASETDDSDAAAYILGCDQEVGQVAEGAPDTAISSNFNEVSPKAVLANRCKWLKRLINHKHRL